MTWERVPLSPRGTQETVSTREESAVSRAGGVGWGG